MLAAMTNMILPRLGLGPQAVNHIAIHNKHLGAPVLEGNHRLDDVPLEMSKARPVTRDLKTARGVPRALLPSFGLPALPFG